MEDQNHPESSSPEEGDTIGHDLPLSKRLLHILDLEGNDNTHITVGDFIRETGDDSIPLLQVLVCLPFCFPVLIPGWGLVAGSVVLYTAYFQLVQKPLDLPGKIENGRIAKKTFRRVLQFTNKLLAFLEKWITPRHMRYFESSKIQKFHSLLMIFLGAQLWFPFPAFIPLSNFFPGIAIVVLSLSLMEYDGKAIWVAYVLSVLATIYFVLIFYLGKEIADFIFEFAGWKKP